MPFIIPCVNNTNSTLGFVCLDYSDDEDSELSINHSCNADEETKAIESKNKIDHILIAPQIQQQHHIPPILTTPNNESQERKQCISDHIAAQISEDIDATPVLPSINYSTINLRIDCPVDDCFNNKRLQLISPAGARAHKTYPSIPYDITSTPTFRSFEMGVSNSFIDDKNCWVLVISLL